MLRYGQIMQLCVVALLGIGVVMIHSAGMNIGRGSDPVEMLTSRPATYAGIALLVMTLASFIDVRELFRIRGPLNPLFLFVLISLGLTGLTLVPGMGHTMNGASRWLKLGPLSFQPSELIKWSMVLAIAWWCAKRRGVMHRFWHGMVPPLMLTAIACGLIVIEDLGTAVLVGAVAVLLLLAGGVRIWQMALMGPAAAAAVVGFIMTSPYRLKRLAAYRNPWVDPMDSGYHPIQSMLAIAMGGPTGRGLGQGIQKFGYLPEDQTDFIFAVICEELGIAGAALVVALYLIFMWAGMNIVRESRDTFGRLVTLGVVVTLGIQATINIAVVTVLVPTKGIALPFVSSGGTGWFLTALAVGLVAGIDKANAYDPFEVDQLDMSADDEEDEDEDAVDAEADDFEDERDTLVEPAMS